MYYFIKFLLQAFKENIITYSHCTDEESVKSIQMTTQKAPDLAKSRISPV